MCDEGNSALEEYWVEAIRRAVVLTFTSTLYPNV